MKFKVGDRVRFVKGGCAGTHGTGHGCDPDSPSWKHLGGTVVTIKDTGTCGPYVVRGLSGGEWATGEAHLELEHAAPESKEAEVATFNTWKIAEAVAAHAERVLYDGPPGTGKTFAAQRFGVRKDQPVFNLTCTEEMPAAELRGHFVPNGDRFVWMDGPAVRAMREGGRLVINEIEKASGDVQTLLLAILDDRESCALTLPTSETVIPADGYTVAATMNGDADQDLPEALRSRFPVRLRITTIHPDAIKRLAPDLQDAARTTGGEIEEERRINIRAWLEFDRLRSKVGAETAAQAVFGVRWVAIFDGLKLSVERKKVAK